MMGKLDKLLEQAQSHLEVGEEPAHVVLGQYETKVLGSDSIRTGIMIATNRRVLFYSKKLTGFDLESFPYENISSFEQGKNMLGAYIRMIASGNTATLKWIKEGEVQPFVEAVRSKMGKRLNQPGPAVVPDAVDQIRKLAELRDAGILTDAEFDAKKAQLLDRM